MIYNNWRRKKKKIKVVQLKCINYFFFPDQVDDSKEAKQTQNFIHILNLLIINIY